MRRPRRSDVEQKLILLSEPLIVVTTTAPAREALTVVREVLEADGYRRLAADERSARLRAGSFLKSYVADSIDIDLIPRFATWRFRADVDLEAVDGDPSRGTPTVVTVHLHKVSEHREALSHCRAAVERAVDGLRARGDDAAVSEIVEGRGRRTGSGT